MKMTNDPKMARSALNVGVIGSSDDVPYLKDQHRSGWPSTLQCASLPVSLAQAPQNMHMHTLSPSEYLTVDGKRVVQAPPSLMAVAQIIARDLDDLYEHGTAVDTGLRSEEGQKVCVLIYLCYVLIYL
jgi:hypothetical protein